MAAFTKGWDFWSLLSALFAELTAMFAKAGVFHAGAWTFVGLLLPGARNLGQASQVALSDKLSVVSVILAGAAITPCFS